MNYVKIDATSRHAKNHAGQVDWALKELRKQLKKDNFSYELKRREHYMSPSAKKKFRKNESVKRRKREERKQKWYDDQHKI